MYLIRLLSGSPCVMRDGLGLSSPVKLVSSDAPVLFEHLPAGLTEHGGPDVDVKAVETDDQAAEWRALHEASVAAEAQAREDYGVRVAAKRAAMLAAGRSAAASAADDKGTNSPGPQTPASLADTSRADGEKASSSKPRGRGRGRGRRS